MAEQRTNKLNPNMTESAEIEPRPHWWKASALTTRSTLTVAYKGRAANEVAAHKIKLLQIKKTLLQI